MIYTEHKGTQRIETERLILRRFTKEDVGAAYKNWVTQPEVTKFLAWQPHESPSVTEKVIKSWIDNYGKDDFYQWAIVPKSINEPIGSISVVNIFENIQAAEIGYCIGRDFWHRGYTSEALAALIPFFFDSVKVRKIIAGHNIANPNSGGVMKKCGLIYEGTLRQGGKDNTGFFDCCTYGMTLEDYKNR